MGLLTWAGDRVPGGCRHPRHRWDHRLVRHIYQCQLRWADQDSLGHINNVLYADYLQEARVAMLRDHAPGTRPHDPGTGVVVVRHEVSYLTSLHFGFAPVAVETWVSEITTASFTLDYEIVSWSESGERTVHVRARSVLALLDFATQRPVRLRSQDRDALSVLLEPGEPLAPLAANPLVPMPGADYEVAVRFSDVDGYNHVNNVKYFEYFQESRIKLMRELGAGLHVRGLHLVVAHTRIDYLGQSGYRAEPYACPSWVSRVGRTSITYDTVMTDGDRVLARGQVVGVAVSAETGQPIEVPSAYRQVLLEILGPQRVSPAR